MTDLGAPTPGYRSGFVGLVGKPNVGKSTILNALLGREISITSAKPQTTRQRILGVLTRDDVQLVFLDSPGWHEPKDQLGKLMVSAARQVIEESDVLVAVIDARSGIRREDEWVFDYVRQMKRPTILALNKVDAVKKPQVLPLIEQASRTGLFLDYVPISAITGDNMDQLLRQIIARLPEGPRWYEPGQLTDQTTQQLLCEGIREEVLRLTKEEVPHAVAIQLTGYEEKDRVTVVQATIVVEREGQKAIIIGKGGLMLKRIGQQARLKLEQRLGRKLFLELWVKVWKDWRQDLRMLRELGYQAPSSRDAA